MNATTCSQGQEFYDQEHRPDHLLWSGPLFEMTTHLGNSRYPGSTSRPTSPFDFAEETLIIRILARLAKTLPASTLRHQALFW